MLEAATVRRPGMTARGHDVGRILDAMLYYDRVHLIVDHGLFISLLDQLGLQGVSALFGHETVTTTITPEMGGIQGNNANGVLLHRPVFLQFVGREENIISPTDTIGIIHNFVNSRNKGHSIKRKDIDRALVHTKKSRYKNILGEEAENSKLYKSLATDPATLKIFFRQWALSKGLSVDERRLSDLQIQLMEVGASLMLATSEPMEHIMGPGWPVEFDWAQVLSNIHDYSIDLYLGQSYSADLICGPEVASIADERIDLSLQRATRSREKLHSFEEMVFDHAGYLGGAFNEGRITLYDALRVIDKSRKMRTWVRGLPPDADIIKEYHAEVTKETILSKLPGSASRFSFFTLGGAALDTLAGAGGLGTAGAIGLSAIDSFLLDRIVKGWRPNIFVENLRKSLEPKS